MTTTPLNKPAAIRAAIAAARETRRQSLRNNGVIIICDGDYAGWMGALRDPHKWVPGCIAVDRDDNCWEARGGDEIGGAEQWAPVK